MKLSSIPQIYRHVGRWYEILAVLSKYELAAWIGRLGPDFAKDLLKARGGAAIAREAVGNPPAAGDGRVGADVHQAGPDPQHPPRPGGREAGRRVSATCRPNVPADPPAVVRKLIESELGPADRGAFCRVRAARRWPRPRSGRSIGHGSTRARRWWSKCSTPTSRRRWPSTWTSWPGWRRWPKCCPSSATIARRRSRPSFSGPCGGNWISAARSGTSSSSPTTSATIRPSAFPAPIPRYRAAECW